MFRIGIDVGSTTAKTVVIDEDSQLIYSSYRRHNAKIIETLTTSLTELLEQTGDVELDFCVTGSAGMGIAEIYDIPFFQELVCATEFVKKYYPDVLTLFDVGGEDTKIIFLNPKRYPDIRMNGNCAGGTGAFIDQMAILLNVSLTELDELASQSNHTYTIASRCGVFAKTDVQNLLSREVSKPDIAAAIFRAVAVQTVTSLARGLDIHPIVLFSGGPLTFMKSLRVAFQEVLNLDSTDTILPDNSELVPAIGAAIISDDKLHIQLKELISRLNKENTLITNGKNRLDPLFTDNSEYNAWNKSRYSRKVKISVPRILDGDYFIGIDSGSTTTKIVVIDSDEDVVFSYYASNLGKPIDAVKFGLAKFREQINFDKSDFEIKQIAVTGYGEDLIKAAFSVEISVVETIAHFLAAKKYNPEVTFILDIGGQDMKAIFIENGIINNIDINEACSSGCGSFIQTFADSLGYKVEDFANLAVDSKAPFDLGTRCTVFMNSKVKQALREGATVADISAGLAHSVIRNLFYKVLHINDFSKLGKHVIVQGGTFKNPAIHRAFEKISGLRALCPEISELMGAYGSALYAKSRFQIDLVNSNVSMRNLEDLSDYQKSLIKCKGCLNNCTVTKLTFTNGNVFFTGNRCERVFSNAGESIEKGENIFEFIENELFIRDPMPNSSPIETIGIPRVLNFYENYPFWHALLTTLGFNIKLSSLISEKQAEFGAKTIMSENICFPAKIVNSHIFELAKQGVDRIFYPIIVFENKEFEDSNNTYNCPIVSGYPEVIRSSINPLDKLNVPYDTPAINFGDKDLLKKACLKYFEQFKINKSKIEKAFDHAVTEQDNYKSRLIAKIKEIVDVSSSSDKPMILLAGRPYHADRLINHDIPSIISDFGANVINENIIFNDDDRELGELFILSQWSYPNRLYKSAKWVGKREKAEFVQLNSFGCGPDAVTIDECKEILASYGKNHTLLRIDEMTSTGSVKLRIRSLIESLKLRKDKRNHIIPRKTVRPFAPEDKEKIFIAPNFSPFYSFFVSSVLNSMGFTVHDLPVPNDESLEIGLKYTNNEICYPAIVIVGDVIKALQSGKYKPENVYVGITETGGQCRATSYSALLRKGLVNAGFENVPVITLSTGHHAISNLTDFKVDQNKLMSRGILSILYADSLAKLYYSTAFREKEKGTSRDLLEKYLPLASDYVNDFKISGVLSILRNAVADFNNIDVKAGKFPRIGIVGEIFVKYNPYGNRYTVDWLINQEIEVVVPPLIDFFTQKFVNTEINIKEFLKHRTTSRVKDYLVEKIAQLIVGKFNRVLKKFRFFDPIKGIRKIADEGKKILSLVHQIGEGWLIPAEIVGFAEDGINNVISFQPFGCLANHVVAKGMERRIRDLYPDMNLLYVDIDAGTSDVNFMNRLHFMMNAAKNSQ